MQALLACAACLQLLAGGQGNVPGVCIAGTASALHHHARTGKWSEQCTMQIAEHHMVAAGQRCQGRQSVDVSRTARSCRMTQGRQCREQVGQHGRHSHRADDHAARVVEGDLRGWGNVPTQGFACLHALRRAVRLLCEAHHEGGWNGLHQHAISGEACCSQSLEPLCGLGVQAHHRNGVRDRRSCSVDEFDAGCQPFQGAAEWRTRFGQGKCQFAGKIGGALAGGGPAHGAQGCGQAQGGQTIFLQALLGEEGGQRGNCGGHGITSVQRG